jgi:hypothetical protein
MSRTTHLKAIAAIMKDYRDGEVRAADADHVERWVAQFDEGVQNGILRELNHVLDHTYISKTNVENFLQNLTTNKQLSGQNPKEFWKHVSILDIQRSGNSQSEMLVTLDEALQATHDISIDECDGSSGSYLYIDDAVFGGGHVRGDLTRWISSEAPQNADVHIIAMATHLGGKFYADQGIIKCAREQGKTIRTHWWQILAVENRRRYIDESDILSPTRIPDDQLTRDYVAMLEAEGYPPVLRKAGSRGEARFFSSEEGRDLLEQEFLKAGASIRSQCPNLNDYQRPLGNMVLKTLGFGAMIVTFRNCANNCPLALWVGSPWYPLFERKIN